MFEVVIKITVCYRFHALGTESLKIISKTEKMNNYLISNLLKKHEFWLSNVGLYFSCQFYIF